VANPGNISRWIQKTSVWCKVDISEREGIDSWDWFRLALAGN
jgi:hypothetical protein